MMQVRVRLGERSYDIDIGEGLLSDVGRVLKGLGSGERVALVTDTNVGPLYAETVTASLNEAGFTCLPYSVSAGERSKSVKRLEELWDAFVAFDMDRGSTVVTLGGGVVGDLAGFAAATYMRGIRYVQLPTTMLACVDSSVGGKTAIDLERGKNLVGAFHQPSAVLIDPTVLATLPDRELRGGLAEVVKYGVILDAAFFGRLQTDMEKLLKLEADVTAEAIRRCCELKASVVADDETEAGRRAILNYGHTVGHALETLMGYEDLLHGEAVAIGMIAASRVAEALGMIDGKVTAQQEKLLGRVGLPTAMRAVDAAEVIETMHHDKKARGGKLTMVLPVRIGQVEIVEDVRPEVVATALEDSRGG